ncbi:hypothetical protein B7494_g4968 [Chlorociboria aeruginascens]|nr:hypothetical protein B7494_g4968 [Chlorociboria aeruginascens]
MFDAYSDQLLHPKNPASPSFSKKGKEEEEMASFSANVGGRPVMSTRAGPGLTYDTYEYIQRPGWRPRLKPSTPRPASTQTSDSLGGDRGRYADLLGGSHSIPGLRSKGIRTAEMRHREYNELEEGEFASSSSSTAPKNPFLDPGLELSPVSTEISFTLKETRSAAGLTQSPTLSSFPTREYLVLRTLPKGSSQILALNNASPSSSPGTSSGSPGSSQTATVLYTASTARHHVHLKATHKTPSLTFHEGDSAQGKVIGSTRSSATSNTIHLSMGNPEDRDVRWEDMVHKVFTRRNQFTFSLPPSSAQFARMEYEWKGTHSSLSSKFLDYRTGKGKGMEFEVADEWGYPGGGGREMKRGRVEEWKMRYDSLHLKLVERGSGRIVARYLHDPFGKKQKGRGRRGIFEIFGEPEGVGEEMSEGEVRNGGMEKEEWDRWKLENLKKCDIITLLNRRGSLDSFDRKALGHTREIGEGPDLTAAHEGIGVQGGMHNGLLICSRFDDAVLISRPIGFDALLFHSTSEAPAEDLIEVGNCSTIFFS